ncbi:MAG: sulfatase-like hydrolase/transferase, partial [Planctomycetaceae bacterium]|nr:sulfatase-like hydrolase/transferase [Planctomycetaceae bacterium]
LSNKACEFVETAARTHPDQPFFLYYAMTTPHNPIVPNKPFIGKSSAGTYGDFVVELDHHVGRLLKKLNELGIAENTLVIFTSDNGPVDRTKGYRQRWVRGDTQIYGHDSNGPCTGWKGGLEEGGHRVPFLVRWPKTIKAGEQCSTTIVFNDVLPTLAEMFNVKLDDNAAGDGQSFFQALTGASRPVSFHKAIIHNHHNGTFAIRQGPYKLTIRGPKTATEVLDDSVPVTYTLYDLDQDIEETTDIAAKHPEKVRQMHALLKQYVKKGRSKGSL